MIVYARAMMTRIEALCAGIAAETAGAAEHAALEACTATTWSRFRADVCN